MTIRDRDTLKSYFNTGDFPTESQFSDFIDTVSSRSASFVVVANDASATWKSLADYQCDGINDEVQIQAAINALPASGGRIVLSPGTFNCYTVAQHPTDPKAYYCILITAAVGSLIIEGQGWGTILKLAPNQTANTSIVYIRGESGANRTNLTIIRSLKIDGNKTNQAAPWVDYADLEIAYAEHITVEGCYFIDPNVKSCRSFRASNDCSYRDNYFNSDNAVCSLRTENSGNRIEGNYFKSSGLTSGMLQLAVNADVSIPTETTIVQGNIFVGGLVQLVASGTCHYSITNNFFRDCLDNNGRAIIISPYDAALTNWNAHDGIIANNVIYNVRVGIMLASGALADLCVYDHLVADNLIIDGPGVNLYWGIYESGAFVNYNTIRGNIVVNATTPYTRVGADTKLQNNLAYNAAYATVYRDENHGAAAAVVDGGTINHGLGTTPTIVLVSGSVAGEMCSVSGITSVLFQVDIKKHDGTPGTAQTIYWKAET